MISLYEVMWQVYKWWNLMVLYKLSIPGTTFEVDIAKYLLSKITFATLLNFRRAIITRKDGYLDKDLLLGRSVVTCFSNSLNFLLPSIGLGDGGHASKDYYASPWGSMGASVMPNHRVNGLYAVIYICDNHLLNIYTNYPVVCKPSDEGHALRKQLQACFQNCIVDRVVMDSRKICYIVYKKSVLLNFRRAIITRKDGYLDKDLLLGRSVVTCFSNSLNFLLPSIGLGDGGHASKDYYASPWGSMGASVMPNHRVNGLYAVIYICDNHLLNIYTNYPVVCKPSDEGHALRKQLQACFQNCIVDRVVMDSRKICYIVYKKSVLLNFRRAIITRKDGYLDKDLLLGRSVVTCFSNSLNFLLPSIGLGDGGHASKDYYASPWGSMGASVMPNHRVNGLYAVIYICDNHLLNIYTNYPVVCKPSDEGHALRKQLQACFQNCIVDRVVMDSRKICYIVYKKSVLLNFRRAIITRKDGYLDKDLLLGRSVVTCFSNSLNFLLPSIGLGDGGHASKDYYASPWGSMGASVMPNHRVNGLYAVIYICDNHLLNIYTNYPVVCKPSDEGHALRKQLQAWIQEKSAILFTRIATTKDNLE
ncbi:hypothetical protein BDA99DRAFT_540755 [Phascolomyces articulosus]|uniref:Uncharacterized protein n=1 Tax=Phascolomyces articulosus TaxID=60185 RepID=A0AAD5K3E6_9FUNG|nr:hypothetical protein BDA99DRAFT_540755 [Phascolomyces articulosus]